jgi:hypothetical protein
LPRTAQPPVKDAHNPPIVSRHPPACLIDEGAAAVRG